VMGQPVEQRGGLDAFAGGCYLLLKIGLDFVELGDDIAVGKLLGLRSDDRSVGHTLRNHIGRKRACIRGQLLCGLE